MFSIEEFDDKIRLNNIEHFDIYKIFDCGQCFRFDKYQNGIRGIAHKKQLYFEQNNDTVDIFGINREEFDSVWKKYLGLDYDYDKINQDIAKKFGGDTIKKASSVGDGIRILHQDSWEALCSFIISQNNNIPRIKGIIENMSRKFGEKIDNDAYAFPTAESLYEAGIDEIFSLKTGFRAKYIYDAAKKIVEGDIDLSLIEKMTTNEAIEYLCQIKGVGLKVASCTLLFGFNKLDAFPVDVWIKRVIEKYYPDGLDLTNLGNYAGIAQQYLFYYERYTQSK